MLRYASKKPQKPLYNRESLQASRTGFAQKSLVTVARRFATRTIGPTLSRQRSGVRHYHQPKNAQNNIINPLLFRVGNGFIMEHCLR